MQYAILFYQTAEDFDQRDDPVKAPSYLGAWGAYVKAVQDSGIVQGGAGLMAPRLATTIRLRDGKRHVQDGPFADSKEQLAGFFLVEVPDVDTALAWAARSPAAAAGSVEVRPVLPPMPGGA